MTVYLGQGEEKKVAKLLLSTIRRHRLEEGSVPLLVRVWIEDEDGMRQDPVEFVLVKDEHGPYYESASALEIGGVPGSKMRVRLEEK